MNSSISSGCGLPPDADTSSKTKRELSGSNFILPLRQKLRPILREKINLIKAGIGGMKNQFGDTLPEMMCELSIETVGEGDCWNGEDAGR